MPTPISNVASPVSQGNFDPSKLPPGTEAFYNSAVFASTLMQFLATAVSQDEKAQLQGLEDIKNAINGQS